MSLLVQPNTFQVETPFPLDDRTVAADETARLNITFRYTGLIVYQEDNQTVYVCIDAGNNLWTIIGGSIGGGKTIKDNQYDETTGNVTDVTLPDQPTLRFGQEFKVEDDPVNFETVLENIIYAPDIDGSIPSPGVGGIPSGTTVGDLRGLAVTEIINRIVFPVILPTYTNPSASLSGSSPRLFKVGAVLAPELTSTYTQNDAGVLTSYDLRKDGISIDSDNAPSQSSYLFTDNLQVFAPQSFTYQTFFGYAEGAQKNDSYGNPSGNPPGPGTLQTSTVTYDAIYPYYFGTNTVRSVTQTEINTGTEVVQQPGNSLTIDWGAAGIAYYWFAVPAGSPVYLNWEDTSDPNNAGSVGGGQLWELVGQQNFDDPDSNYAGVTYDVYITSFQTELQAAFEFTV